MQLEELPVSNKVTFCVVIYLHFKSTTYNKDQLALGRKAGSLVHVPNNDIKTLHSHTENVVGGLGGATCTPVGLIAAKYGSEG